MKRNNFFAGLNERNVLSQIGKFGEDLTATLLSGEVISHTTEHPFVDVVNISMQVGVQVKMCNGRHAQRPMPQQINRLYDELSNPFLYRRGLFVLIFYGGVYQDKGRLGKSMIWSRKFSMQTRRRIIAHELQYIYIVDVNFMKFLLDHHSELLKRGAIVSSEGKSGREIVLYLNRTFLSGFL
ncbi:MAG: hypothetical protein AAB683_00910, partial [Patescibacteria group bacterium]